MRKSYRDVTKGAKLCLRKGKGMIELDAPCLGTREKEYVSRAIDSGFVSTFGPFVPRFEENFAGYVKVKKAVSTQNGTAAIHIALHELQIGKKDEVIVPVTTFVATVNPVLYLGATPVFVDIDPGTWDIDPDAVRKAVTKRTKAILPVHLFGNPCDMRKIMAIAREHGLYVVEDAAESLGAKYRGKFAGTIGDLGCFSFNGNKVITTGGGGMVVGKNKRRMSHIKFLVNQARNEAKGYYHPEVGFNYRMTNIEAALGLAQMEKLDIFLGQKRKINAVYKRILGRVPFIGFQEESEGGQSSCWSTAVLFKKRIDIPSLQKELRNTGIPSRRVFMPLIEFPPFKKYKKGDYRNAYYVYERGLCLPSSTLNSEADICYVCDVIIKLLKDN